MRDAVDEIIWRHVRSHTRRPRSFFWPGEMAVVTIKFLRHGADVRQETDQQVGQCGFVRVLGEIDPERMALRAANRPADSALVRIPFLQQRVSFFEFICGHVEASAGHIGTIVEFRRNVDFPQSPLEWLGIGAAFKE